ncbi:MAG: hypothetical protein J6T87_04385, partial [Bacteroidales bacterium]|nr:hypothetical protein [Bacteroidales bacterium]
YLCRDNARSFLNSSVLISHSFCVLSFIKEIRCKNNILSFTEDKNHRARIKIFPQTAQNNADLFLRKSAGSAGE